MTDMNPTNDYSHQNISSQSNGATESWLDINDKEDPRGRLGEGWPWSRPGKS